MISADTYLSIACEVTSYWVLPLVEKSVYYFINAPSEHWHSWICLHLKIWSISHDYNSFPDLQEHICDSVDILSNSTDFSPLIWEGAYFPEAELREIFACISYIWLSSTTTKSCLYFQVTTKTWYIFIKNIFWHLEILTAIISRNK